MLSLKERITAPSHQQYVEDYCRKVRPVTVFHSTAEYDQRVIIRFLYKERVSPEDIQARLEVQHGDVTCSERSVRRWCQYLRQRREDLHDEVRSGRPPFDFLDIRIPAQLDEQPFHSAYSIAEILSASRSIILSHLRESLGMNNFHFSWIPHELTTALRQIRIETYRELLPILKGHEKNTSQRFVTGDKSWFTLEFHHSSK